jgi:TRAP transporter TAXI family solute receptor
LLREILKVYGPIVLIVVAVILVALRFVDPPPPREIRFAAGAQGSLYASVAGQYRDALARDKIQTRILETPGSVENLRLLARGEADVALVQGGLATEETAPGLVSLAGVTYEPVWILVRAGVQAGSLAELRGRRIAIGPEGSGTRALARQLLAANEIDGPPTTFVDLTGPEARAALERGDIDAAVFVVAEPSQGMISLISSGTVRLLPFAQAEAYAMRIPFLSIVRLPAGAVSLARNIPAADMSLVAPTTALVVREDIHPALVSLLLKIARDVYGGRQLFAPAGAFPSKARLDLPLHEDAARYLDRGPSFLFRYLPFGVAVWIERMTVLIIPLVTILLPIFRFAPPAYRWQVQRKIYKWYGRIRKLETEAATAADERRAAILSELDAINPELATLKVPASYAQQLFELRMHLDYVRTRLANP